MIRHSPNRTPTLKNAEFLPSLDVLICRSRHFNFVIAPRSKSVHARRLAVIRPSSSMAVIAMRAMTNKAA
jgi:hypothetical protein